jgi:hypothetical protein
VAGVRGMSDGRPRIADDSRLTPIALTCLRSPAHSHSSSSCAQSRTTSFDAASTACLSRSPPRPHRPSPRAARRRPPIPLSVLSEALDPRATAEHLVNDPLHSLSSPPPDLARSFCLPPLVGRHLADRLVLPSSPPPPCVVVAASCHICKTWPARWHDRLWREKLERVTGVNESAVAAPTTGRLSAVPRRVAAASCRRHGFGWHSVRLSARRPQSRSRRWTGRPSTLLNKTCT